MKKIIFSCAIILLLFKFDISVLAANSNVIVHVTVYGEKYHREDCSYLSSDIEMTLSDAINNGYTPCSRCKPPTVDNSLSTKSTPTAEPITKNIETKKDSDLIPNLLLASPIIAVVLFYSGTMIFDFVEKKKEKKIETQNYNYYFSMFSFYDPIYFVNVPKSSYIKDGLPVTKGSRKYGNYTVYVSAKGKCFHQNPNCSKTLTNTNYVYAYHLQPCKRCVKDGVPKIQWFLEYKKIVDIKKKYNIP